MRRIVNIKLKRVLLLVLIGFASVGISKAQQLAWDDLDAATGSLDGVSSGSGWDAAWHTKEVTSAAVESSTPLSYDDIKVSGNYAHRPGETDNHVGSRKLDIDPAGPFADYLNANGRIGKEGTEIWVSFLYKPLAESIHRIYIGRGSGSDWPNNDFTLESWGGANWKLKGDAFSDEVVSDTGIVVDKTYLFVVKFTFNAASTDIDLYINPTDIGGEEPSTPTLSVTTTEAHDLDGISFVKGECLYDEIRFGKTYKDVTPLEKTIVNPIADQDKVTGDVGEIIVPFSGVKLGYGATQLISTTATSSDVAIIPHPTVTMNAQGTGGDIKFTPTNTKYGNVTITLTLQDDGGTADGRIDKAVETFEIEVVDPDLPEFGFIADKDVYVGSGENVVLIPGINDGNDGSQTLSVTAVSTNPDMVDIVSVDYDPANTFGVLKLTEKGATGSVDITVTVSDEDGSLDRTFKVNVVEYEFYGLNFSVVDAVFWQKMDIIDETPKYTDIRDEAHIPSKNEFDWDQLILNSSAGCEDCDPWNMATAMISGYIIPPETGDYTFLIYSRGNRMLKLSQDHHYDNADIIADLGVKNEGTYNEETRVVTSDPVTLEAGKVYAMYGISWYVFSPETDIEWIRPDGTRELISTPNAYYKYDPEKPQAATALTLTSKSASKIAVHWSEASDNVAVTGYNLYLDGLLWNDELITDTTAVVDQLSADTDYSIAVSAVDNSGNESALSNILNAHTYPVDDTPPAAISEITTIVAAPMALKIGWKEPADETGIYGYNVFIDDEQYNTEGTWMDTCIVLSVLTPEISYAIKVEAIDAGENTSISEAYTANTTIFDPMADNLGIKTGTLNIETTSIGAFDGFGLHAADKADQETNIINPVGSRLTKEFDPTMISWGGIQVNPYSLNQYSGVAAPYTIADFFSFGVDSLNSANIGFACGVCEDCDWYKNEQTFLNFMEYIGGDKTTTWGAIRAAEGYEEPFLPRLNKLIFSFGVETWGGTTHSVADDISSRETYTQWAKDMEDVMKSSPYYQEYADKIEFGYSMRNPDPNFAWGVNEKIMDNLDTAHCDYYNLGGYLHANVGDGAEVEGTGMEYYKNLINKVATNTAGLKHYLGESLARTGEVKKAFFYETNMGNETWYGTIGHALPVIDHGLAQIENGSIYPCLFVLSGAHWSMTAMHEDYRPFPIYTAGQFVNHFAKGQLLKADYETQEQIYTPSGEAIDFQPVGTYVFAKETDYSVLLLSRDYENDHYVQIKLPAGINHNSASLEYYVFTTDDLYSTHAHIDTLEINTIEDGMLVKVPKYSLVALRFTGDDLGLNKPLGYVDYVKQTSLELSAETTTITDENPGFEVMVEVFPEDAVTKAVKWEVTSVDNIDVTYLTRDDNIYLREVDKNGTFVVNVYGIEDSTVTDAMTFTVDVPGLSTNELLTAEGIQVYPNPVRDNLYIDLQNMQAEQIRMFDMTGTLMTAMKPEVRRQIIDMSAYSPGTYILEVSGAETSVHLLIQKVK